MPTRWAALLFLVMTCAARPDTLFVDATASGPDGGTWATAFDNLQDALIVAVAGDEIRVAQGIYHPAPPGSPRSATFMLVSGVAIYGGYAGLEGLDPNERDIDTFTTILSGDLNENDGADFTNRQDNVYHVVTAPNVNAQTLLDGVTIAAGNANGPTVPDRSGAGVRINLGSLTMRRCTFVDNHALFFGGAIHSSDATPTIERCTFRDNRAEFAGFAGGAIASFGPTSRPTIVNSRFHGNRASLGGAIEVAGGLMDLANCVFTGNVASSGGAINVSLGGAPTLTHCTCINNVAIVRGGAIHTVNTSPTYLSALPEETRSRLLAYTGRTMHPASAGQLIELNNCVLWSNMDGSGLPLSGQLVDQNGGFDPFQVAYSCVRGITETDGNLNRDPAFVNPIGADGTPGTPDDDLRLTADSPCIDTGDAEFTPQIVATDLLGHPRILCGRVDMGAFEFGIADFDCDRDVDLVDFSGFQRCFSNNTKKNEGCDVFDFDGDNDVDLADLDGFQNAATIVKHSNTLSKR